jgi:hypothetical protein
MPFGQTRIMDTDYLISPARKATAMRCTRLFAPSLAGAIAAVFDYLRGSLAAGSNLSAVPRPSAKFCRTLISVALRGFHQRDALLESHLATSSKRTLNCAADVRELWRAVSSGPFPLTVLHDFKFSISSRSGGVISLPGTRLLPGIT